MPGLTWGDVCPDCLGGLHRRASPVARRISLFAALLVVAYAWWGITLTPASRVWVAGVAIGTYFVVRKIATAIAIEVMRKS
ncbi:MAG: hypothetical protein HOP28_10750 [Gemmatimonadales bacterium]|nr:hypothetical protein [Gemmatimonadales bacterium]